MKRIKLGNRLEASAVALGCMRMAALTVEEARRVVDLAVERGVDFFDHADIYGGGKSEQVFGEVLRQNPGLRDKVLIQDKVGICKGYYDASYEHIIEAAEGCLARLGVEYIDVLLLHRPDALMEPEEVAEAFDRLHAQGKVRFFGVSNENAGQMALLRKYMKQELIINQLQFGPAHTILVDEGMNVNIHSAHATQQGGGTLDYCRLNDITIQAWSPFQHGMFEGPFQLSEKYAGLNAALHALAEEKGTSDAAVAVAWILRHPANIQVLLGSMNEERIAQMCDGGDVALSRQEWYQIYRAAGNPIP